MKKRKVASENLLKYSDYELNKMYKNGEIAKCPICKKYHEKNIDDPKFLYNISYCDKCREEQKMIKEWLSK